MDPIREELATACTRRTLIQRAAITAALAQLPAFAVSERLLEEAEAVELDLVKDTLKGLMAFVLPGDDEYSKAQGEWAAGPGGVGAGAVGPMMTTLDQYLGVSGAGLVSTATPLSGALAVLLNTLALQVDPGATGPFLSPFARLSSVQKAKVFELFESSPAVQDSVLRFAAGVAPGLAGFMAMSEAGALRPDGSLASRPVGWALSKYQGPREGHAELRGYYEGRRCAGAKCPRPRKRKKKTSPAKRRRSSAKARRS